MLSEYSLILVLQNINSYIYIIHIKDITRSVALLMASSVSAFALLMDETDNSKTSIL